MKIETFTASEGKECSHCGATNLVKITCYCGEEHTHCLGCEEQLKEYDDMLEDAFETDPLLVMGGD